MKKAMISFAAAVAVVGLIPPSARADIALNAGDGYYLGFIQAFTSMPANETAQAGLLNTLITVSAGSLANLSPPVGGTWYDRRISTLPGPFPTADPTGVSNVEGGQHTGIGVNGFAYIIGQYNGPTTGFHVWYVPAGTYSIPEALGDPVDGSSAKDLSHYAVYTPDGGTTLMLLGGSLLGLGILRRRLSA